MPYLHLLLPAMVGLLTGGLFMTVYHVVQRRRSALPPPAEKIMPEHDPFVHGSKSDKRTSPRRGGNPVPIRYSFADRKGPPSEGWVLDRSVGGLCLTVPEQLSPGSFLRIFPSHAPESTPWVEIEVRSCRSNGDNFELNCQFVKQPPWSVLLLFG